jgi:hypothetical protein
MNKEINVILYYTLAFQGLFQILLGLSIVSLCVSKVFNRFYRMLIYVHYSLILWCEIIKLLVHARWYCFFELVWCVEWWWAMHQEIPQNLTITHVITIDIIIALLLVINLWLLRSKSCFKPCLPFFKLRHDNAWK